MIRELVNYSEWLKKDFPDLFEGSVTEGLHILIDLDDNGCVVEDSYKSEVFEKGSIPSKFLNDVKKREIVSNALGNNKGIVDKVIFSNNPYAIFFKLYFSTSTKEENKLNVEEYKEFVEKYRKTEKSFEDIKEEFLKKFINHRLEIAFRGNNKENKSIDTYYKKIEKKYFEIDEKSIEKQYVENIKKYVKNKLKQAILNDDNFRKMFLFEKDKEEKKEIEFKSTFFDKQIRVNFNIPVEILQKASSRYFSKNIFNKAKFNQTANGNEFGLSNFFNKTAEDKIFNLHRTAFYKTNTLIKQNWGILLNEFLNASDFLPKVLPVFIDKTELNARVIKIFKKDVKKGYKEIISNIANNHEDDLQNYYLLNFGKTEIKDLDFVSSFNFKQKIPWFNQAIELFFAKANKKNVFYSNITNIFNIEEVINEYFFYNKLSYFGSIKKTETTPNFLINNFHKYNKLLYDAFYKSRLQLITANIFKDICMPVIRYEISHDETSSNGYSKNEFRIKEKLLIYIHFNQLFDHKHNNFGGIKMTARLPDFYHKTRELIQSDKKIDEDTQIDSDELWAFSAGQLIYYLLSQSKASNRSHAMFEPFLRKFNDINAFKKQILSTYEKYKHEIDLNNTRFNQLVSKVIDYPMSNEKLKEFEVIVYSGYFAKSLLYEPQRGE